MHDETRKRKDFQRAILITEHAGRTPAVISLVLKVEAMGKVLGLKPNEMARKLIAENPDYISWDGVTRA